MDIVNFFFLYVVFKFLIKSVERWICCDKSIKGECNSVCFLRNYIYIDGFYLVEIINKKKNIFL